MTAARVDDLVVCDGDAVGPCADLHDFTAARPLELASRYGGDVVDRVPDRGS